MATIETTEPEAVRLRDLDDEAAHEASEGSGEHQTGDGPLDMVRHGDVELGGSCLASPAMVAAFMPESTPAA